MLDYGFANFETHVAAEKGEIITTAEVQRGTPQKITAVTADRITALVKKGETDSVKSKVLLDEKVALPLKAGDKVGTLQVLKDGKVVGECDLVSDCDVEKASFTELIKRMLTYKGKEYGK